MLGIPIRITSSVIGLRISAVTAGVKKYNSIFKKKKKKRDKIILLVKTKLYSIEDLISKAWTDSYISHDEFFSVNYELKGCNDIKKETQNLKSWTVHQRFPFIYKTILLHCLKCSNNTENCKNG